MYIPIFVLVIYSFNKSQFVNVWAGFSLKWYASLFQNDVILTAAWVSIKIAIFSATLSVFIALLAVIATLRFKKFAGRLALKNLVTAPMVVPDLILGMSFLLFFIILESFLFEKVYLRGIPAITLAHTTLAMAYSFIILRGRLATFDTALEEAALDLGARPLTVFLKITLPLILPSLLSSWLLAFSLSLDDVVMESLLSGPGATTLPMVVFSSLRYGLTPEMNALATIIIGLVMVGVTIGAYFMHRKSEGQYGT